MPKADLTHSRTHTQPQIKVKTLTGKEIDIDIETDDTIARIKVPHAHALPFESRWRIVSTHARATSHTFHSHTCPLTHPYARAGAS